MIPLMIFNYDIPDNILTDANVVNDDIVNDSDDDNDNQNCDNNDNANDNSGDDNIDYYSGNHSVDISHGNWQQ